MIYKNKLSVMSNDKTVTFHDVTKEVKETVKKSQIVKLGHKKTGATEYIWTNHVPRRAAYYVSMHDYKENISWEEYWRKIKQCYIDGLISKKDYKEYCFAYSEFYKGEKELDALI